MAIFVAPAVKQRTWPKWKEMVMLLTYVRNYLHSFEDEPIGAAVSLAIDHDAMRIVDDKRLVTLLFRS